MFGYVMHDDAGNVVQYTEASSDLLPLPPCPDGYRWTPCPAPAVNYVVEPDGAGGFQAVLYVPPDDVLLQRAKDAKWVEAKNYRDMRMSTVCSTPFGDAQIDDVSKIKISGVVQMAGFAKLAGSEFSEPFTPMDNIVVDLSADQWIALGVAVGMFVSNCQKAGTIIRAQIDASSTLDAVSAIDITAGYPA